MAKLKPPACEDVRVNVRPGNKGGVPWIRVFVHRYQGDKKGEFMGHCDLSDSPEGDELALRIGRLVLESSLFLKSWARKQNS